MISNERPSPYGRRPYGNSSHGNYGNSSSYGNYGGNYGGNSYGGPSKYSQPRPPVQEDTLKNAEVQIERKAFHFALKENPRGRFLRITEDVNGRRDTIIIPSTGLAEFKKIIDEMVKTSEETPSPAANPPDPMA